MATTPPPTSLEIVESMYNAFYRRDLLAIFAHLSPSLEIRQSEQLPWGGTYHGHDGARQFFGALTRYITSSATVERYLRAGEHVVVIGWTEGKVNANGNRFRVPFAHVWEVSDQMVTRVQFLIDNPAMLSALA